MKNIIIIIQIIISIFLSIGILMQGGGAGLGSVWSGGADGSSYRTRRGLDKVLFYITGVLALAFFISSLSSFLV